MSRSNRYGNLTLALIALAVVATLCTVLGVILLDQYRRVHDSYAQYQRNAANDRRYATQEIADSCRDAEGYAFRVCIADHLETYYAKQATNEDLQAQQDMAFWAMVMAFITFVTTIVTGIGVWLVVLNLKEARVVSGHAAQSNRLAGRAAVASQNAADAAFKTIEETSRIGEAQTRAYVHLQKVIIKLAKDGGSFFITADIVNSGQTPARKIITQSLWACEKPPFKEEWWNELGGASGEGSLGSGEKFYMNHRTDDNQAPGRSIATDDIPKVIDGRLGFWLISRIAYKDVFGGDHISYFRGRFAKRDESEYVMTIEPTGREDT